MNVSKPTSSGKDKSTLAPGFITVPLTSWVKVFSFVNSLRFDWLQQVGNLFFSERTLMGAVPLAENSLGGKKVKRAEELHQTKCNVNTKVC